jgi:glycosyltransferase involved in cell wall biosynthesis
MSNNSQPLITIIIATYNEFPNIQKTLDGINNQKYNNVETVVIDGKSNDGTIDIIKKNQELITHWISENDSGLYHAWNKGIKICSGDWIMFLGAGDYFIESDALDRYVKYINKSDNSLNFISTKGNIVDSSGNFVQEIGKSLEKNTFLKYMTICHPGSLHHKSLFLKYGYFDISYKLSADYEFLVRCLSSLNATFIPDNMVNILDGGISSYSFEGLIETKNIKLSKRPKILVHWEWLVSVLKLFLKINLLRRKM